MNCPKCGTNLNSLFASIGGKAGTGAAKARPSWQMREISKLGNKARWASHNAEKRNKERSEKK